MRSLRAPRAAEVQLTQIRASSLDGTPLAATSPIERAPTTSPTLLS